MTEEQIEVFVRENADVLTHNAFLGAHKPAGFIEMGDIASFPLLPNLLGNRNGYIEVKKQGGFLSADNNDMRYSAAGLEASGTIYFEIWLNWLEDREKMIPGWIFAMFDPAAYTSIRREDRKKKEAEGKQVSEVTAVTPGVLAVVLTDENENPFACVAFEDIPKLLTRLYLLCPDSDREKWGLPDIDGLTPAANEEYWNQYTKYYDKRIRQYHNIKWNKESGGIIEVNWHIPFRNLADIATVTMIGSDPDPAEEYKLAVYNAAHPKNPEIKPHKYYGSEALIKQRLNAVKEAAQDRRIPDPAAMHQLREDKREKIARATGKPCHGNIILTSGEIQRYFETITDPKKVSDMKFDIAIGYVADKDW